jgi:hypothetical protein
MTQRQAEDAGQAAVTPETADGPELRGTYFAVRIALVVSALMVMAAPAAQWAFGQTHTWPQSISDSFYTTSKLIFVIGLGAASMLLLVVRADQFIEHTLLKVGGMFGLVVSAVACVAKDGQGDAVAYDQGLATQNRFTLGALLILGTATWLFSLTPWFPADTTDRLAPANIGTPRNRLRERWNVDYASTWTIFLTFVPAMLAVGWLLFSIDDAHWLTRESHLPAAIGLFGALAGVATCRTKVGLWLMDKAGDHPVDDTLNFRVLNREGRRGRAFDLIYAAVAILILLTIGYVVARMLQGDSAPKGWLLAPEFVLLTLFGLFWGTQTIEALKDIEKGPA